MPAVSFDSAVRREDPAPRTHLPAIQEQENNLDGRAHARSLPSAHRTDVRGITNAQPPPAPVLTRSQGRQRTRPSVLPGGFGSSAQSRYASVQRSDPPQTIQRQEQPDAPSGVDFHPLDPEELDKSKQTLSSGHDLPGVFSFQRAPQHAAQIDVHQQRPAFRQSTSRSNASEGISRRPAAEEEKLPVVAEAADSVEDLTQESVRPAPDMQQDDLPWGIRRPPRPNKTAVEPKNKVQLDHVQIKQEPDLETCVGGLVHHVRQDWAEAQRLRVEVNHLSIKNDQLVQEVAQQAAARERADVEVKQVKARWEEWQSKSREMVSQVKSRVAETEIRCNEVMTLTESIGSREQVGNSVKLCQEGLRDLRKSYNELHHDPDGLLARSQKHSVAARECLAALNEAQETQKQLKSQLEESRNETTHQSALLAMREAELKKAEAQLELANTRLRHLEDDLSVKLSEMEEHLKPSTVMKSVEYLELAAAKSAAETELRDARRTLDDTKSINTALRGEKESLELNMQNLQKIIDSLSGHADEVDELASQSTGLGSQERADWEYRLKAAADTITQIEGKSKADLEKAKTQNERSQAQFDKALDMIKEQLDMVKERLDKRNKEVDALKTSVEEMRGARDEAKEEARTLKKGLTKGDRSAAESLKDEVAALRKAVDEGKEKYETAEANLRKEQVAFNKMQEERNVHKKQAEKAHSKLVKKDEEIKKLKADLDGLVERTASKPDEVLKKEIISRYADQKLTYAEKALLTMVVGAKEEIHRKELQQRNEKEKELAEHIVQVREFGYAASARVYRPQLRAEREELDKAKGRKKITEEQAATEESLPTVEENRTMKKSARFANPVSQTQVVESFAVSSSPESPAPRQHPEGEDETQVSEIVDVQSHPRSRRASALIGQRAMLAMLENESQESPDPIDPFPASQTDGPETEAITTSPHRRAHGDLSAPSQGRKGTDGNKRKIRDDGDASDPVEMSDDDEPTTSKAAKTQSKKPMSKRSKTSTVVSKPSTSSATTRKKRAVTPSTSQVATTTRTTRQQSRPPAATNGVSSSHLQVPAVQQASQDSALGAPASQDRDQSAEPIPTQNPARLPPKTSSKRRG